MFAVVFGKSVPDNFLNTFAKLGYVEGLWIKPVYSGDTLRPRSEVIGRKQNSNGKSGNVYMRTTGFNQSGDPILEYGSRVMVKKRNEASPSSETVFPVLKSFFPAEDLVLPEELNFRNYNSSQAGRRYACGGITKLVKKLTILTM